MAALDDFKKFVSDEESSAAYATWAKANCGGKGYSPAAPKLASEVGRWLAFRSDLIAGHPHSPPGMTTAYGKGLVDAGVLYLDAIAPPLPPPPPGLTESPDGTIVKGTIGAIVDAGLVTWTITPGGQIAKDGKVDPVTGNVTRLYYTKHVLWQENASAALWWPWDAAAGKWGPQTTIDPIPGDAPPPAPVPVPVPATGKIVLTMNNVGGGGSKAAVLAIGTKALREDVSPSAVMDWATPLGIRVIQIIQLGGAGAADGRALAFELGNEPYWHSVDPATWAPAAFTDAKNLRAAFPKIPILLPLVAYGAPAGANGMDGVKFPGEYAYPNGGTPYMVGHAPWVDQIDKAAPGLLGYVDGFAVHPYYNDPPFHVLDVVRASLTAKGHGQPFWYTEAGMFVGGGETEDGQLAVAQSDIAAFLARPDSKAYTWYRLEPNAEGAAIWGLINWDGSLRKAYPVVKAAIAANS